jgi:hypothetical protein
LCGPTALAMLLDRPLREILDKIGHDGSEIWWPEAKPPRNMRGFTFDELIDVADYYGRRLMLIQAEPKMWDGCDASEARGPTSFPFGRDIESRIEYYLRKYSGMIIGCYTPNAFHAVAWNGCLVYDPSGKREPYSWFDDPNPIVVESFLALD